MAQPQEPQEVPAGLVPPEGFDPMGRPVSEMSNRDLLMEMVYQLRSIGLVIQRFQTMKPTDMMKAMMGGNKPT